MDAPTAPSRPARGGAILGFIIGMTVVLITAGLVGWRLGWLAPANSVAILDTRPESDFSRVELRGRTIYYANCASCHGGPSGGDMMDYPPKHNSNGHTWHHPDCELKDVIRSGGDEMTAAMRDMMAPPNAPTMPAWKGKLSEADIEAVLAYIKTMWFSYERDSQAEITRRQC